MELKQRFFEEYALKAAVDQMAEEYRAKGYEVEKEADLGTAKADLVARQGDELLIFGFKGQEPEPSKGVALRQLRHYVVDHPNAKLKLVLVKPPHPTTVQIDGLQRVLYGLCSDSNQTAPLNHIASSWQLEQINDVVLENVQVMATGIEVKGTATALYLLFPKDDELAEMGYPFPVSFHLSLDQNLEIVSVQNFSIDVSDFA
jgi:hypothetical protein